MSGVKDYFEGVIFVFSKDLSGWCAEDNQSLRADLSPSNQTRSGARGLASFRTRFRPLRALPRPSSLSSRRGQVDPPTFRPRPSSLSSRRGQAAPPTFRPRPSRARRAAPRPAGAGTRLLLVSFPEAELIWFGERCAATSKLLDTRGLCVPSARAADRTSLDGAGPALLQGWRDQATVSSGRGAWRPPAGPQALPRGSGTPTFSPLAGPRA